MLYYLLFWTILGFIFQFYIIFGTNLLIGGPAQISVFFAYFSVSKERNIKQSPNGMKPSEAIFLEQTGSRGLWVDVKEATRMPWCRAACPGAGAPPTLVGPSSSTDLLLPPIYTYVPRNHRGAPRKPNSTTATFCTREIPSWGLFRHSAGGGIDHGGLLHQHHSLSDDVWVVYHRPSGP